MIEIMKRVLLGMGHLVYWCGWPVFWVYFRVGYGRTRVIVEHEGKILVVKQWIGDGRWQLPGGGMHKGELVRPAALRELREETGLELHENQLIPVGEAVHRSRGFTFKMYVFRARWPGGELRLQRHEIAEAVWLRPDQLSAGNTRSDTLAALQMIQ
jgi:8-oxo-dGTP diphosphatase